MAEGLVALALLGSSASVGQLLWAVVAARIEHRAANAFRRPSREG